MSPKSAIAVPYVVNLAQLATTTGNFVALHRSRDFVISGFTDFLFLLFAVAFVQSARFLYVLH